MACALCAAMANLFISSRAMYALALTRRAPRIFFQMNKAGTPLLALGELTWTRQLGWFWP